MSADLTPHPLVQNVAKELHAQGVLPDDTAATAGHTFALLGQVAKEAPAAGDDGGEEGAPLKGKRPDPQPFAAVLALAGAQGVSDLVTFTGYLGASFDRYENAGGADEWTILYLDPMLQAWLLIETAGIVYRYVITDHQSPFDERDVIWVKTEAGVGRGSGSLSIEAQFLTGTFTSAGDYDAPPSAGGTLSAATGAFCEGRSPGCCRKTPR